MEGKIYHEFLDMEFTVKEITFRLLEIDAPEMYGKEEPAGERTKQYLQDLILGKDVVFEGGKRDSFGRVLAYVWFQGMNVNQHLIEEGFAKPYED